MPCGPVLARIHVITPGWPCFIRLYREINKLKAGHRGPGTISQLELSEESKVIGWVQPGSIRGRSVKGQSRIYNPELV